MHLPTQLKILNFGLTKKFVTNPTNFWHQQEIKKTAFLSQQKKLLEARVVWLSLTCDKSSNMLSMDIPLIESIQKQMIM